jgi:hypothetical protein
MISTPFGVAASIARLGETSLAGQPASSARLR